jgi:hypothetical protein
MPPLLYVGGLALSGLLGLTAFCWKGFSELDEIEEEEEEAACALALLFERRKGEYVSLKLEGRKVTGWIADVVPAQGLVLLDVRRVKVDDKTGKVSPKDKVPGPADMEEITTAEIERVTVHKGHALEDAEEEWGD